MANRHHYRVRYLTSILSDGDPAVMIQIIRMVVVYEQLRLELYGAAEGEKIESLDLLSKEFRQLYFVRRGLASVIEIEQAVHKLNMTPEFKKWKKTFSKKNQKLWDDAARFFAKNHSALNDRRGLYAGHFSDRAATFVLQHLHPDTAGLIQEITQPGKRGSQRIFKFAEQLLVLALTADKGEADVRQFIPEMFELLTEAFGHATESVVVIGHEFLFEKFGAV